MFLGAVPKQYRSSKPVPRDGEEGAAGGRRHKLLAISYLGRNSWRLLGQLKAGLKELLICPQLSGDSQKCEAQPMHCNVL